MSKKSKFTQKTGSGSSKEQNVSGEPVSPLKQMVVLRSAVLFAAVIVILAGIKAAAGILTPVLLALFVTILLLVPLRWLYTRGCPSGLAFALVGGTILLLFLGLGWLMTSSLKDFLRHSGEYSEKIVKNVTAIENKARDYGFTLGFTTPEDKEETTESTQPFENTENGETAEITEDTEISASSAFFARDDHPADEISKIDEMPPLPGYSKLDPQLMMRWVTWGGAQLSHFGENLLLFLIILMFMIFEAARFPAKLEKAFGDSPITNDHFRQIVDDIRRYIVFKGMSNLLSCTVVTTFYFIIGVKYAPLWGLIAFFLYFIPNIGAIISAIPPLLLIFVDQEISGAVTLVAGLLIIESIIGYGIEPRLLGHGLGISTVVVFLSLIFWGWLLGPIGLFLAAPLTIVVKIVLQAFDETRWVAILLDEKVQNAE
ncbi:MAG: AI-2E family transporter [Planctomycetaceae bacterium]|nr:AI-2E family transporter [Planctomycetaceae bacterium]